MAKNSLKPAKSAPMERPGTTPVPKAGPREPKGVDIVRKGKRK